VKERQLIKITTISEEKKKEKKRTYTSYQAKMMKKK
jgi:hypothetical protein